MKKQNPLKQADCGGSATYWLRAAQLKAGVSWPVGHDDPSHRRRQPVAPVLKSAKWQHMLHKLKVISLRPGDNKITINLNFTKRLLCPFYITFKVSKAVLYIPQHRNSLNCYDDKYKYKNGILWCQAYINMCHMMLGNWFCGPTCDELPF